MSKDLILYYTNQCFAINSYKLRNQLEEILDACHQRLFLLNRIKTSVLPLLYSYSSFFYNRILIITRPPLVYATVLSILVHESNVRLFGGNNTEFLSLINGKINNSVFEVL
jgi:hypothetical protein